MMTDKKDIYQTVTDSIIAMLERGTKPWAPQWSKDAGGLLVLPRRSCGTEYRGLNTMILWGAAEAKGYRHQTWMTFNQAKALGGCVRKGEKGTQVVYWGRFDPKGEGDEGTDDKGVLFAKAYSVFNVGQIDGLPDRFFADVEPLPEVERIDAAECWVAGIGADVRHGGNRAFFSPAHDFVQMPPAGAFVDVENYYSTLAHELTHWTGHKSRLDREFGKRFGSNAYAFEELVAELGAAFAMAKLGISAEPRADHADYLASWLKVLKQDKRAIFTAASKAQAACDYLFEAAGICQPIKAAEKPVQWPSAPSGVICLPDLSKPVSEPETDDDDTDPTPPVAPCPSPLSSGVAAGFAARLARFSGGRVRAYSKAVRGAVFRPLEAQEPVAGPVAPKPSLTVSVSEYRPTSKPPMTLLEFLSRAGGLRDDGGELRGMDAHLWHRAKPFRRRLVAVTGMGLDYACDLAWERGFFDDVPNPAWDSDDNMHPVTQSMLLAAIRAEMFGKPRYAHGLYVEPEPSDYAERWEEAYPEEAAITGAGFVCDFADLPF
jgi:antirestriction protein ArdC